ncbi:hypothetical protein E4U13_000206 [Claviceps humidiphila]|uniref:Uncharacterized protein n=1 Tax=Claviceps humidiphila TaxID=1294629 RepID=A0A9P7PXN1_9HYPO|nr:hypothetical protein E4U13_000206 [Claviceps humidiphila]
MPSDCAVWLERRFRYRKGAAQSLALQAAARGLLIPLSELPAHRYLQPTIYSDERLKQPP